MKYRNKTFGTIVVEADQYRPGQKTPGVTEASDKDKAFIVNIFNRKVYIQSGDWILHETDGVHHYYIADNVFVQLYEPCDPSQGG